MLAGYVLEGGEALPAFNGTDTSVGPDFWIPALVRIVGRLTTTCGMRIAMGCVRTSHFV
jgi:hypothetical protein